MSGDTIQINLTIVRHGQTESNNSYVVCGQANDPLTPVGQDQARAAGAALADKKFDKVYASPLERTLNTCKAIVVQNKSLTGDEIKTNPLLMERNFGKFEKEPIINHIKLGIEAGFRGPVEFWNDFNPETVETMSEVRQRAKKFTEDVLLKEVKTNQSVLLVGHGIWIQQFLTLLYRTGKFDGVPTEDELRVMTCPNTGVTELELLYHLGKADQDQLSGQCTKIYRADHISKGPGDLNVTFAILKKMTSGEN